MPKIALVTCQNLPELTSGDQRLIAAFAKVAIEAQPEIWNNREVDWKNYDAIIIRNTWDYYQNFEAFSEWLNNLKNENVRVFNSVETIQKNIHKFYLKEFAENGVCIIPTLFSSKEKPISYAKILAKKWATIVVKPAVSAGSFKTELYSISDFSEEFWQQKGGESDWLIQEFLPQITRNGEISLVFLNGKFSHSIVKTPINGDFRVQKQYGGLYKVFEPSEELIEVGKRIVQQTNESLLFARVDGVLVDNVFQLMELELIEPDLYFEFEPEALGRFVEATHYFLNASRIES